MQKNGEMPMRDNPQRVRVGERVTIFPRGKKRIYVADFWAAGKHCRTSLKTPNKKAAIERATKLASDLHQGTYRAAPAPVAFVEAAAEYLTYLRNNNRALATLMKNRGVLDRFSAYLSRTGVGKLAHVTALHLDRFQAERREKAHRSTVHDDLVIIKAFFKWARSRKLLLENPIAEFRLDKPPLIPKPAPSMEQVDAILTVASEPFKSMFALLSFTGMRSGELRRLRREDVDLPRGWIHICSREGAETKTHESRKVPIHPRLRPVLESLPKSPHSFVFTAAPSQSYPDGGHQIGLKTLNVQFKAIVGRLGMAVGREDGFVIHSLRHFFETFCVNSAIPQRVVDAWLGHTSDQSMAAHYYMLSDSESQRFMKQVPFGSCGNPDSGCTANVFSAQSVDPAGEPATPGGVG
jgi:integrase